MNVRCCIYADLTLRKGAILAADGEKTVCLIKVTGALRTTRKLEQIRSLFTLIGPIFECGEVDATVLPS